VSPLFLPHLDEICPANAIGAIPDDVPVLILAGTADRLARPEEAQALHKRIAAHSRLVLLPGAGHGDLLAAAPKEYSATVLEFVAATANPATRAGRR
jgi:uncharacterized protein